MKKVYSLVLFLLVFFTVCFSQDKDLEFSLDVTSSTIPLPKIFKPNIDLSGRGMHREASWPQELAASEVLDIWQKEIGFNGLYRLQYNLWQICELNKDKELQNKLLNNYESIIKKINEVGGIVILNIFGMPPGLGKVLDKKSAPFDLKAFKELIKSHIKNLSCDKKYNIWYEVWNAPDLDDFFLGRKQEYLNLYKAVAEAILELEVETKIHIPLGGPAVSFWFQNFQGNTIVTAERSLIYELIKFCAHYHLPLNFISWHTYSTCPKVEKQLTTYNKDVITLMRNWLSYFDFDRNTPLIVDEWNYDSGANVLPERKEKSFICASYILSRIKNMYEAGIDYQLYYCLEDFKDNKEAVVMNVGLFEFDSKASPHEGRTKATYNVFKMLNNLGSNMFAPLKINDEFVGAIATKEGDSITILIYNYIDPEIAKNYLSNNIALLSGAERKFLLNLIKTGKLEKIMQQELDIPRLRTSNKVKTLLKKAKELNEKAVKFKTSIRNLKMSIKNLRENYLYQKYTIDSSCSINCGFSPIEEKEITAPDLYQETLSLNPYSVNMVILKKKPKEIQPVQEPIPEVPETKEINKTTD